MPLDSQVTEELTQLIHPHTLGQVAHFHRLGLRQRLLTLPVRVALVLTMIWRQIGRTCTLVRLLRQEGFLWCSPIQVTQQASMPCCARSASCGGWTARPWPGA
jgi:hypothetical protein